MASQNYDESLRRLLVHEGGYTNHPSDPGGPTKYGITIHDYRKYIDANGTAADVKNMTLPQAKRIYDQRYWSSQRCNDLPAGVDYSIFDYGVNSGIGRSGKVLRRLCGLPDNTSVVTPEVVDAVRKRDAVELVKAINTERLAFLKRLKTWPTFGKGWGRRVSEVLSYSLMLCQIRTAPVITQPTAPIVAADKAKGEIPDSKGAKTSVKAAVPAVGAAGGYGFWDWIVIHPVKTALIVLVIGVSAGVFIHWLNYRRQQRQEAATPGFEPVPVKSGG